MSQLLKLLDLGPAILDDLVSREVSTLSERSLRELADVEDVADRQRRYDELVSRAAVGERVSPPVPARGARGRPRGGFVHQLERARTYELLLGTKSFPSMTALARAEGVSGAKVARCLALLRLAPEILERLEQGEAPVTELQLRRVASIRSHAAQRVTLERLAARE